MLIESAPQPLYEVPLAATERFLPVAENEQTAWQKSLERMRGKSYERDRLTTLLAAYNRDLGADEFSLKQVERLRREDTVCVVTGQQLGFMGGPAYTFLKIIHCLILAQKHGAIPVFWAATEDHDQDEVSHCRTLDRRGNLLSHGLTWPDQAGWMVEDLPLTELQHRQIASFWQEVNPLSSLRSVMDGAATYAQGMLRLITQAFHGTGLVIVEPKLLRSLAVPLLQEEVLRYNQATQALTSTYDALRQEGILPPVDVQGTARLFCKDDQGRRTPIRAEKDAFRIRSKHWSSAALVRDIEQRPECYSANVTLRPLVQSYTLPTAAYVAGPTEWLYHHQLASYFALHEVPFPHVVPRLSATFVPAYADQWLRKLSLNPFGPLPSRWEEVYKDLQLNVQQWQQRWKNAATNEVPNASKFLATIRSQLRRHLLVQKLADKGVPTYALHYLNNLLRPYGNLQERTLNWWQFQSSTQENLVQELCRQLSNRLMEHSLITLR